MSHATRLLAAGQLVADHRDVLEGRPGGATQPSGGALGAEDLPASLTARGWDDYLLALDDEAVAEIEIEGSAGAWPGAPSSLLAFATRAREVCSLPALAFSSVVREARRHETPRKRAQVEAFVEVLMPLARVAKRVVDVGSGHGHLTRDIAARITVPVVGLERDPALAHRARALSGDLPVAFAVTDVLDRGLVFDAGDCVIGLHACGDLGDAMVESVARSGAALVLVGCCLQKRRASSRRPLCENGLELPTALLGLSNLTARDDGVEASRAANLAARERRLALHRLLVLAVGEMRHGSEIEGLNRRAAHGDLETLVARGFARRGLAAPPPAAIEEARAWAAIRHARLRRLSLPRSLLARVLEVFVLLDRARHLEQRGRAVTVGTLFPAAVSARNLVLVAP